MEAFARFIAPMTPEIFFSEYYGRKPVHIRADDDSRRALLSWSRFNALLGIEGYWTAKRLKMVRENVPIVAEHYSDVVRTADGPREVVDPAKVQVMMALGASLIADDIHAVSPDIKAAGAALGERLGGSVAANAYCSFRGYRGFGAHFDLHEVFAVHTEGEKTWRLYEARADNPTRYPEDDDEAVRQWFDATKGRVLFEATMRPGDVIYIPRGWYHDALAQSEAALHLTFSVTPLSARVMFGILEREAMLESDFRAYLPDGAEGGGTPLRERLTSLGRRLAEIAASAEFEASVHQAQRGLQKPPASYHAPRTGGAPEYYKPTGRPGQVTKRGDARVLRTGSGEIPLPTGVHAAVSWVLRRPAFSVQELQANFPQLDEAEVRSVVASTLKAGLIARL